MNTEEWRPIPGHPDYDVSNHGRVRSWKQKNSRQLNTPHVMSPYLALGYRRLTVDSRPVCVHQLVAAAWHGPRPEGMEVDHINHNRADNRPENLRYITHRENVVRRILPPAPTECPAGHPYKGTNVYVRQGGSRVCRECNRIGLANLRKYGRGDTCSIDNCERAAAMLVRTENPICEMHYQRQRRAAKKHAKELRALFDGAA